MTEFIELCGTRLPVVPQKHARLRHLLSGEDLQKVMSADYAHETYRILGILIPALPPAVPEYKWEGFSSQEAYDRYKQGERDAYVESEDNSPTTADIVSAFEKALMVSGADRLGKILNLVTSGSNLVGAQQTGNSPASPGENGASRSESTGTPAQT